jgi:GxxExxY protein
VEEFSGPEAELSGKGIKVFYSVANELGYGFFESVYRRAMVLSLRAAGLKVGEEIALPVMFHGQQIGVFVADLIVNDALILELKAADEISRAAVIQLTHYLRSCDIEAGLVLAFGLKPQLRRVIFTNDRKASAPHYPS